MLKDFLRRQWLGHRDREPASSARFPAHRSESPTGYSSVGCSPAEPASASPVANRLATPDPAMQSKGAVKGCSPTVLTG
jgi:hypothetical protein